MLPDRAALIAKEAAPEKVILTRPVPMDRPDDPICMDTCAIPTIDSQDTKLAASARTARMQDWMGALSDDLNQILTPRPPYPQATIGTQIDETNQPKERLCWRI